ncbi:unnamed protein product [Lactuca saligna]|uniref:DDE Tnp4 domain-containing protein n=1 Tax=Lactuca saligna TaxID=75948 RepID=A0AA35YWF2_LACSI|nr:unnamed protein product [Lactuca saligna]
MQFTYVLPGWEGSAVDGRILHIAMLRENGLQVSKGNYYLVDVGYTNGEGFIAPFRGQRYHLNTWLNGHRPEKAKEYFTMKHSVAWNVIERRFGVHKNVAKWRGKNFPHYWDQCLVFGNDVANGRDAQTTTDVISNENNIL